MKFKALVITILFVAGIAASVAVAKGPPPGKGKGKKESPSASSTGSTSTSTAACKPKVAVILKGDFVSGGSDDEGVFQMKVRQANQHGKRYVAETVTIAYDEKTKFTRRGHAELDDFEAGDWLNVQARACKQQKPRKGPTTSGSTSPGASAQLLAKRVTGKPGKTSTTTTGTTTAP